MSQVSCSAPAGKPAVLISASPPGSSVILIKSAAPVGARPPPPMPASAKAPQKYWSPHYAMQVATGIIMRAASTAPSRMTSYETWAAQKRAVLARMPRDSSAAAAAAMRKMGAPGAKPSALVQARIPGSDNATALGRPMSAGLPTSGLQLPPPGPQSAAWGPQSAPRGLQSAPNGSPSLAIGSQPAMNGFQSAAGLLLPAPGTARPSLAAANHVSGFGPALRGPIAMAQQPRVPGHRPSLVPHGVRTPLDPALAASTLLGTFFATSWRPIKFPEPGCSPLEHRRCLCRAVF